MGGTNECDLNITYNYSGLYHLVFPIEHVQDSDGVVKVESTGLKWLYGKTGEAAIPILEKAIERLGTQRYERTVTSVDSLVGLVTVCQIHGLNVIEGGTTGHPHREMQDML